MRRIMTTLRSFVLLVGLPLLSACATARLPVEAGTGPRPALPPPRPTLIPAFQLPKAIGWPPDAKPRPAEGLRVAAFARGLEHPRWLCVLPNGDVLVAESAEPPQPDALNKGVRALIRKWGTKRLGAAVPSANRITLLRDTDGDGVADRRSTFLEGLHSPIGMALVGERFYVGNTDAVLRFDYRRGQERLTSTGVKLVDLPGGPRNYHWTKVLLASRDGRKLYVSVGSNSNIGEGGMDREAGRAAIWEIELATGLHREFARGLRNPVGLAWEPDSGALWTVVNERDELSPDLVPDYLTSVREGGFYGWPYSYFGQHVDPRVEDPRPDLVATAIAPDYALGPHVAPLGLASARGTSLPVRFANGMFVAQHGSYNRRPTSGYRVVFVPFAAGRPAGAMIEVLTGFLSAEGKAQGRPAGLALDRSGALLVADDVGNTIWRVTAGR
jgi:glucose/arabinose dehydrogenase